ncbi:unnamed protein product, partial [Didymodactylos carnosus]
MNFAFFIEILRMLFNANLFGMDDNINRLNRFYTIVGLLVGVITISTTTFFGNPISCWCQDCDLRMAQYYVDNFCWIMDTRHAPQQILRPHAEPTKT